MKGKTLFCVALVTSVLLGVVVIGSVSAQSTTVGVEPLSIVDAGLGPGSTFTVEIWIRNVINLAGVEFTLGYDTAVLTATSITYGDIFGTTYFLWGSEINDAEGYLRYAITEYPGEPAFDGDGRAAVINFTVDSYGDSALDLYNILLRDPDVVPIVHTVIDGYFSNVGPPSTTIGVEPVDTVDPGLGPASTFTIEIWIRDVEDLAGYEFKLGYDTTVLTATLIEYGDIFGPTYFPLISEIRDAEGYLLYAVMEAPGEPSFYGDGRAAIITFSVDSVGDSALHLYDTKLGDSSVPPEAIIHDALDGYFSNVGAVVGWIEGTVTDADTLLPIEGATVSADGISDVTDPSGFYSIEVSPGTYDVTAEMTGYEPQTVMDVSVAADAIVVHDFALTPITPVFGWIEGTVTDADTLLPIEGATVSPDGYSDTTDASGFYSIEVSPGTYDITAEMTGYVRETVADVSVSAHETVIQDFALSPAPPTTIGVEPDSIVDLGLGPGSTFTVEIWIRSVQDLRGVEFHLGYDTTVLTATDIEYGGIFGDTYFPLASEINDDQGYLHYAIIEAFGEPGFYGDGCAVIINFTVDSWGESDLDLYDTKLADASVPPMPIDHDVLDGYFNNVSPPPPEALEELVETIETWNLRKGTENSLTSKLGGAIHLFNKGNENGAIQKLMAFINQVEALRGKKLSNEQADYLTAEAQRIIDLIKG